MLQSHGVEEELSEGRSEGDVDHDEAGDSCDEGLRRHHQDHPADVLAKLKMQVRDIKVSYIFKCLIEMRPINTINSFVENTMLIEYKYKRNLTTIGQRIKYILKI